jgi:Leucine-rich repeat (LRR) protein
VIGKGFDDDGEVDLSEITEADVLQKKLELMQEELEQKYQDGLQSYQDPEKLIQLKHLRLSFLNIGPNIQNLEFFENLENLLLQHNNFEEIGKNSLQFNLNLQMINLSHNKITKLQGLTHLNNLIYFNISHNLIEEFDPQNELPKNL